MVRSVLWRVGGAVIISGVAGACAPSVYEAPPAAPEDAKTNVVSVIGRGEVKRQPDIARVTVGVSAVAPTAAEASSQVNRELSAVIAAIKKQGVAEQDIQTANLTIHFERLQPPPPVPVEIPAPPAPAPAAPGRQGGAAAPAEAPPEAAQTPRGQYRVTNTVRVTIRDLEKVGALLDSAVTAGANEVWGISFGIDDPKALEAEAREKAAKDARERAEALAKTQGRALGEVVSMSDHPGAGPGPVLAKSESFAYSATPVAPGEMSVSAHVEVVYRLGPPPQGRPGQPQR